MTALLSPTTLMNLLLKSDFESAPLTSAGDGKIWRDSLGVLRTDGSAVLANDASVVHIAGAETITGIKTVAAQLNVQWLNFSGNNDSLSGSALSGRFELVSGLPVTLQSTYYEVAVRSLNGLKVQNVAGTADAPITASTGTFSGAVSVPGLAQLANHFVAGPSAGNHRFIVTDQTIKHDYATTAVRTHLGNSACGIDGADGISFGYAGIGLTAGFGVNASWQPAIFTGVSGAWTERLSFDLGTGAATFSGDVITDKLKFPANATTTKYITPTSHIGDYLNIGQTGAAWYEVNLFGNVTKTLGDGGFKVRNLANTSDAPITASTGTFSSDLSAASGNFSGSFVIANSYPTGNLYYVNAAVKTYRTGNDYAVDAYADSVWLHQGAEKMRLTGATGNLSVSGTVYTDTILDRSNGAITIGVSSYGVTMPGQLALNKSGTGGSAAINISSQNLTIGYNGTNPFIETYDKTLKINTTNAKAVEFGGDVGIGGVPSAFSGWESQPFLHLQGTSFTHIKLSQPTGNKTAIFGLDNNLHIGIDGAGGNVFLRTDGVARWQVASTGHLYAYTDDAYDIGASGTNRPRDLYLAGDVILPAGSQLRRDGAVGHYVELLSDGCTTFNTSLLTTDSGTAAFRFRTSNGATLWYMNGDGSNYFMGLTVFVGGVRIPSLSVPDNSTTLTLHGGFGAATAGTANRIQANGSGAGGYYPTSGTQVNLAVGGGSATNQDWKPTSGTANITGLLIEQNLNTSGTYSGTHRSLYIKPILTSTTGLTNIAIESTSGDWIIGGDGDLLVKNSSSAEVGRIQHNSNILSIQAANSGYPVQFYSPAAGGLRTTNDSGAHEFVALSASELGVYQATIDVVGYGALSNLRTAAIAAYGNITAVSGQITADYAIVNANATVGGYLTQGYQTSTADPLAADISAGSIRGWHNSVSGDLFFAANVSGTIKKLTFA